MIFNLNYTIQNKKARKTLKKNGSYLMVLNKAQNMRQRRAVIGSPYYLATGDDRPHTLFEWL